MIDPRDADASLDPVRRRYLELLAANATEGLAAEDAEELARLRQQFPDDDPEELERAAALVEQALAEGAGEPLPAWLADRIARQAAVHFAGGPQVTPPVVKAAPPRRGWRPEYVWGGVGWVLAAALLAALLLPRPAVSRPTPEQRRAALLAEAADVVRRDWAPPQDAAFAGVTGDVVWSDARQEGYLRLRGMPANDPKAKQYQLWIVDPRRDKHPVDGGVFDIPAAGGEVVVPIQSKLAVRRPDLFAITLERPGGVVVSAGPLLVVAK